MEPSSEIKTLIPIFFSFNFFIKKLIVCNGSFLSLHDRKFKEADGNTD